MVFSIVYLWKAYKKGDRKNKWRIFEYRRSPVAHQRLHLSQRLLIESLAKNNNFKYILKYFFYPIYTITITLNRQHI